MRLIDAETLKEKLEKIADMNNPKMVLRFYDDCKIMINILDEAPIVEERKNGHWIDIDLDTSICSVCKNPQEYETRYCPECGAIMDI